MVNRLKLNEKTVREAENLGRDYQIFDTDVRGFSITIYPSGNRAFTLDYRVGGRAAAADDHRALAGMEHGGRTRTGQRATA
jgi:hypothetical protein